MDDLTKYVVARVSQKGWIGHGALVNEFAAALEDLVEAGVLRDHDDIDDSGYELTEHGREMADAEWPGAPR